MENSIISFLFNDPLYSTLEVTESVIRDFYSLYATETRIDTYCPQCKCNRVMTFQKLLNGNGFSRNSTYFQLGINAFYRDHEKECFPTIENWRDLINNYGPYLAGFFIKFQCAMDDNHYISFALKADENEITKIGQFPSQYMISAPIVDKYKKILEYDDRKSLNKAIALYSQNIGIGSFSYIRRVFENLVNEAVLKVQNIEDEEFKKLRVKDKIKRAKEHLPEFLVENSQIYSILSKGVHELSEGECLTYFPVIKDSVIFILEQKSEEREKAKLKERLSKDINRISSAL